MGALDDLPTRPTIGEVQAAAAYDSVEALERIADALEALLPMVETLAYPLRVIDAGGGA